MCQSIRLCSSRFTVVEAHLHVTASFKKSVARLVCNSQSFEQILQHSPPRLWSCQHLAAGTASSKCWFLLYCYDFNCFNSPVKFHHVPAHEGYGHCTAHLDSGFDRTGTPKTLRRELHLIQLLQPQPVPAATHILYQSGQNWPLLLASAAPHWYNPKYQPECPVQAHQQKLPVPELPA